MRPINCGDLKQNQSKSQRTISMLFSKMCTMIWWWGLRRAGEILCESLAKNAHILHQYDMNCLLYRKIKGLLMAKSGISLNPHPNTTVLLYHHVAINVIRAPHAKGFHSSFQVKTRKYFVRFLFIYFILCFFFHFILCRR